MLLSNGLEGELGELAMCGVQQGFRINGFDTSEL